MTVDPQTLPSGEPALRTLAMPADANPNGDIFGGWLLSQMDVAGAVMAYDLTRGRIATVAVEGMSFLAPVFIGDLVSCYAQIGRIGRTSVSVRVESYVRRRETHAIEKVTEGVFTYVAIDRSGKPRPIRDGEATQSV